MVVLDSVAGSLMKFFITLEQMSINYIRSSRSACACSYYNDSRNAASCT